VRSEDPERALATNGVLRHLRHLRYLRVTFVRIAEDHGAVDPVDAAGEGGHVQGIHDVVIHTERPLRQGVPRGVEVQDRDGPGGWQVAAQKGARALPQSAGMQQIQRADPARVVGMVMA
jgi:hypothetical protein